jgi:hypothetical protein
MKRLAKLPILRGALAHRPLIAILAVFVLLSLTYGLLLPLGEPADEISHFALVRFIAEQHRPPLTLEERQSLGQKGDASPIYHSLVALFTQHVAVTELPALPDAWRQTERYFPFDGFPNTRLFHTEDETFPFRGIVLAWHLARLTSALLGAATVIAVYLTALAIYPSRRPLAAAAAGFVAFLPRFVVNSAVITDDNLVVPLVAFSIYCLVRVAQGDERRRTFVLMGALMGLAAATKYHALVLLPEMTAVLAVLAWRVRWGWRTWLRRWGWTALAFTLASGWWFAFLMFHFNRVAELGWVRGLAAPLGDPVLTAGVSRVFDPLSSSATPFGFTWIDWVNRTFRLFWIEFGPADRTPLAIISAFVPFTVAAAVGMIGYGWTQLRNRTLLPPEAKLGMVVLAFHLAVYLGVVMMRYQLRHTADTAQGRHLYPALAAIAFFFILGLRALLNWLRRRFSGECLDRLLAFGLGGAMLGLSSLALPLFFLPGYTPYLPIVTAEPEAVAISHRFDKNFAKGLNFAGYDLPATPTSAGQALPVTLYWHVGAKQERDYLVRLCLRDSAGQTVTCQQQYPVDGRYPTRAWESGYTIRDQLWLPLPACLPAADYELTLSMLPLRLDTAATTVDTAKEAPPVTLGRVTLAAAQPAPLPPFDLWVAGQRHDQGGVGLPQVRQALTVVAYGGPADVHLTAANAAAASGAVWSPLAFGVTYPCPGGPLVSVHNFLADPAVRPGSYHLRLGNQSPSQPEVYVMTRLRNFTPPASLPTPVHAAFAGEVELLGYALDLSPRRPGDTIYLTAYWQALRTMSRARVGVAYLLDPAAAPWAQTDQTLGGPYPNVLWASGEVMTEEYHLTMDPHTPPGLYTIQFGVYDYEGGAIRFLSASLPANPQPVDRLYLGQLRVTDPAEGQPPSHPFAARLGDQIHLLGYDLSAEHLTAGQPLRLALHWQASGRPAADYTVFTQLLGPDGQVWAQFDNQPQAGRYPTSAWAIQTKIVDRYELKLKEGAPPGDYRLLVGMYDLASGQRLPAVAADGSPFPDNAIPLIALTLD